MSSRTRSPGRASLRSRRWSSSRSRPETRPTGSDRGVRLRADRIVTVCGPPIHDGAVAVRGATITAVGTADQVAAVEPDLPQRDLGATVLMPGFVDAHCHLEWSLTGGLVAGGDFAGWLGGLLEVGPRLEPRDFAAAAALGTLRALEHGTTTLADSGPTGAAAEALRAAGLRGVVHLEVFGRHTGAAATDLAARHADRVASLDGGGSLVRIGVAPHAPYTVGPHLWHALADHPDLADRPWTTHLAESPAESRLLVHGDGPLADLFARRGTAPGAWPGGGGPAARLHAAGALRAGLVAAHCVHLPDGEEELLHGAGVSAAHCPRSNDHLGCGRAPLARLRAVGVAVGLGTDSPASGGDFSVAAEARACNAAHAEASLSPADLVELATLGGAKALGLGHLVGTLAPGKRADLIAVATDSRSDDPCSDVLSGRVRFAMVDGVVVLEGGRPTRLDPDAVVADALASRARITGGRESIGTPVLPS